MLSKRLIELSLVGAEWVLWLLIVLSVFALAAVLDRVILFFRTREPSSASVDGVIAPPAGPRQRDSRYFARPSCIQMGTVLRLVRATTRWVYSCAIVSSQS